MDLDSLKGKSRRVTAPAIDTINVQAGLRSVDELITLLKEGDERERKKLRKSLPFFVIAAVIFVIAFVAVIVPGGVSLTPSVLFLRGMLMILYVALAVTIGMKLKGLAKIDYCEPVRSFLARAEKRYAFITTQFHVFGLSITLFLGYGAFLYFSDVLRRYFEVTYPPAGLIVTLFFFASVYGFGFWATRRDWKKEKQDIWLRIRKMREELDFEESSGRA